ncbi:VAMP-like protein YKT61 [Porphyridium purpureum]|uniref:VAMP-like protein YKT61 n=1 Tax=Porphyridium purpureum TaxID=35688 RepID=A0A5J4YWS6_PORPP|nr:VAMP-like protein YKT61 [Porphyridium purpureum]|eukprot:POR3741..scf209_3
MKIVALLVLRCLPQDAEAVVLADAYHLNEFSYFQRGSVKEFALFFSKTVAKRVDLGQRSTVEHQEYNVHVHVRANGLGAVALCDQEYPTRVAFTLLLKLLDDFCSVHAESTWRQTAQGLPFPEINETIEKYQNPAEADNLMKLQREVDETKVILHKTVDSVLERGVKLDNLVDKSNDLSAQSKMFYQTSKNQNSCCSGGW